MPLLAVGAALHQRGHLRLHLTEHRSLTSPVARELEVKEQLRMTSAKHDSVHVLQCCGREHHRVRGMRGYVGMDVGAACGV